MPSTTEGETIGTVYVFEAIHYFTSIKSAENLINALHLFVCVVKHE